MGDDSADFEFFEKEFTKLIADFQLLTVSESRLKETLRKEATRAEAAEATRDAAERSAVELRANAAAAAAGAAHAAQVLTSLQENLQTVKIQFELSERTRALFEEKCTELSEHIAVLEKELQQLRPLQPSYSALQRQYVELQEQIHAATEDARREVSRLESDLRRVERSAGAGTELRERARLAAAAHARDRRLAAAELQDTLTELQNATAEIVRFKLTTVELQSRLSGMYEKINKEADRHLDENGFIETKAALEAERNTSARLERALHAALADNASLAKELHRADHTLKEPIPEVFADHETITTNILCPIDLFLADN